MSLLWEFNINEFSTRVCQEAVQGPLLHRVKAHRRYATDKIHSMCCRVGAGSLSGCRANDDKKGEENTEI